MENKPLHRDAVAEPPAPKPLFVHCYWKDMEICATSIVIILAAGLGCYLIWMFSRRGSIGSPSSTDDVLVLLALTMLFIPLAPWALLHLLRSVAIDSEGITFRSLTRLTRIRFDEVTEAKNTGVRLTLKSKDKRIVCPLTKAFRPYTDYLVQHVDILRQKDAMERPWNADPETAATLAVGREFSGTRLERWGTLAVTLLMMLPSVIFAIEGSLGLVAGWETSRILASLFVALFIFPFALSFGYCFFLVSSKVVVDDNTITLTRFGARTCIDFSTVDAAEVGHGLISQNWILLRSHDKAIRISEGFGAHRRLLLHVLFERIPLLKEQENIPLPLTVRAPRLMYAVGLAMAASVLCIGVVCFFGIEDHVRGTAALVLFVSVSIGTTIQVLLLPMRYEFGRDTIMLYTPFTTRTYDVANIKNVEYGGRIALTHTSKKLLIDPAQCSMPTFLLFRILRRAYETAPSNNESVLPSRASGDIG